MAKTNTPPPPGRTKGEPPKPAEAPGNLSRDDYSDEMVNLNFTVPKDFRQEFKMYAARLDKSMVDVLREALEAHKKQNT